MTRQTFIRSILKCPLRTVKSRLLISFVIGYVSAGLVRVMIFSTAYPALAFHDRIAEGIAASFMGTIFLGMGYEYGDGISLWPYIVLITTVVFLIWMVVGSIREHSSHRID